MPLVVLLPNKVHKQGDWLVVDIPVHYEGRDESDDKRQQRASDGQKENARESHDAEVHSVSRKGGTILQRNRLCL